MEMDKIKEVYEKVSKINQKKYDEHKKEIAKNFKNIFDDSNCIIATTNLGTIAVGSKVDIMACLCATIDSLLENKKLSKEDIEEVVRIAFMEQGDLTNNIINTLKDLNKEIDEILGD